MLDAFKKIQRLVEKTGERVILVDAAGDPIFVIMPFGEYEKLIQNTADVKGLSEEEFLEKINRDIAVWRSSQEDEKVEDWEMSAPLKKDKNVTEESEKNDVPDNDISSESEEETYYFEPID